MNHPVDIHYTTKSLQGWPRFVCQVWTLDSFGRASTAGYGFAHLPCIPGVHTVEVACWRPTGTLKEEVEALFLGHTTQLTTDDIVFGSAWDNRWRLVTAPSGSLILDVAVMTRHFTEHNVDAV